MSASRLFVAVMAERDAGKSTTWNTLFSRTVKRGKYSRKLEVAPGKCVDVYLVSGSFEEREEYSGDILADQDAPIVLCSVQYIAEGWETFEYAIEQGFDIFVQWLNPGFHDTRAYFDELGFANRLLAAGGTLSVRDGTLDPRRRTEELRDFIIGWASSRDLIVDC
jgi:hypothetical protein